MLSTFRLLLIAAISVGSFTSAARGAIAIVTTNLDIIDAPDLSSIDALTNDPGQDGAISLREAVTAANNTVGQDTIAFESNVTQPIRPTLTPDLTLSDLTGGTTLVATGIVLDGQNYTGGQVGLRITSPSNIVFGLTVIRFADCGICIEGNQANQNTVSACRIGIREGAAAGNGVAGLVIRNGASQNVIAGESGVAGNIISGNGEVGVFVYGVGTDNNSIAGNYIGTNEDGTAAVPNGFNGVTIGYGASSTIVGGLIPEMRNVISGNTRSGIFLIDDGTTVSRNNQIWGNYIGLASDGATPLGNGFWGIYVGNGPTGNFIGADDQAGANLIAHNVRDGIEINGATTRDNRIFGNRIYLNGEKAIDLVGGANNGIVPPVITGLNPLRGSSGIPGGLVELFVDTGDEANVRLGSSWNADSDFSVPDVNLSEFVSWNVLATVTDTAGNTSELSLPFPITEAAEGEGEGEGEPQAEIVTVEVTEADDLCQVYLNGELILETGWGEGPGGATGGNAPGNSGPVDITQQLRDGSNTLRFVVQNAALCCGVSGFFEVKINGVRVYFDGVSQEDSTEGVKFFDTYEFEWDTTRADLIVCVQHAATLELIPQAVVRVSPTGQTARIGDDGLHRFLVAKPGTYRVIATAAGFDPEETPDLVFVATSLTIAVDVRLQPQDNASRDSDGDGLPDNAETNNYGTDPNNPDTDGDGMSDLFEVQNDLNNTLDDSLEDPDGDGFSNLREFFLRSNPRDPGDPRSDFYVSTAGNDGNAGTKEQPWRTIGKALAEIPEIIGTDGSGPLDIPVRLRALADETRATVLLSAGTYQEDIVMQPLIRVQGAALGQSIVRGHVTGAPRCTLANVRVDEPSSGMTPLISIGAGPMLLERVTVQGRSNSTATGIVFEGLDSRFVLVTDCVIARLKTGIEVRGAIPLIRRTRFTDISGDALVFKPMSSKLDEDNSLGEAGDTSSGWNRFENIGGKAVVNERDQVIRMENNDWDTNALEEVADLVEGPADYEPYLAKGAGLLPSSIVCTIWDAVTSNPVTNASLALTPGGFTELTENIDGIYTFACIPAGTYTVTVNAPGYDALTKSTTVAAGGIGSIIFTMGGEKSSDDGCTCFKSGQAPPRPLHAYSGKFLVMAATLGALLHANRKRKQ